jgi:predicted enzyme involved in methoxymalonyl-ACP biosynthesis
VKLVDALRLSHQGATRDAEEFGLFLACSFPPLHLGTFLGAHFAKAILDRRILVNYGDCGDLIENLHLGDEEDKLRRHSIEQNPAFDAEGKQTDPEEFLRTLEANITIKRVDRLSSRAWELINKTNQFNLNGRRYTMDQWQAHGECDSDFVLTVTYEDRFGSLGTIATMAGRVAERRLYLEDWAISCRAFSRRVEYLCLALLFDRFEKDAISIAFRETERNRAVQNLVKSLFGCIPVNGSGELVLTSKLFGKECPRLYQRVSYAG